MSRLSEIQEQLQSTSAMIARLERAIAKSPTTRSLPAMIRSFEKRLRSLEEEYLQETNAIGVDVCSYRLFSDSEQMSIRTLAASLEGFQRLVSIVYDAIKSGYPKKRRRISSGIMEETGFNFGYTYAGSTGVVFTLPNDRILLGESHLDASINSIFGLAKSTEASSISEFAKSLGPASIKATYDWIEHHAESGVGVDIQWRRGPEVKAHLMMQAPELVNLYQTIGATSEETTERTVLVGYLVGADINRRRFHLETSSGHISGSFTDAIHANQATTIPKMYLAHIDVTTRVRYATGEEKVSYMLIQLDDLPA